jgi:hypothetical protein
MVRFYNEATRLVIRTYCSLRYDCSAITQGAVLRLSSATKARIETIEVAETSFVRRRFQHISGGQDCEN